MTATMEVLYSYAQDYMVRGLLDREAEYGEVCRCAGRQEQTLRDALGGEHRERLENLLEERKLKAFYEGQAWFQAGFQAAVELLR